MRPIDADALYFAQRYARADPDSEKLIPVLAVDKEDVEEAPTIDAVPVVRCKDCMFEGSELTCPMLCLVDHTEPDEFCSFGRKKGGWKGRADK